MSRMHIYQAKIVEVIDGDTFDLMIDLGFNNFTKQRMRLYGIDAPEMRTKAGRKLAYDLLWSTQTLLVLSSNPSRLQRASSFATSMGGIWPSFMMRGRLHRRPLPMGKRSLR
jgi:hypothetical protein